VEAALQPGPVADLVALRVEPGIAQAVHVIDAPHGPGMHRRVEVGELPFVGRDLAVGVLELLEQQQPQLFLGELGVDDGEGHAVEGQVPGGEPGILPLVRHGHDAHGIEM